MFMRKFNFLISLIILSLISCVSSKQNIEGRPVLTSAGPVHICEKNEYIVLIERAKAPFGYAMFGGHVDPKESPISAFKREMLEELSIKQPKNIELVGVYGNYGRDPRQHSVEVTYSAITLEQPKAASDARKIVKFTPNDLKIFVEKNPEKFAFDHAVILKNYLQNPKNLTRCQNLGK